MSRSRPSWDEYWINKLEGENSFGERATCDRGRSSAILVDEDQQIITTGYVGAPRKLPHCDEVGHLIRKVTYEDGTVHEHCKRTGHAELSAIVQAARVGRPVKGATLYCTMEPCIDCAIHIINAGIKRVVAKYRYHGAKLTREWFAQVGIAMTVIHDQHARYADGKEKEAQKEEKLPSNES